MEVGYLEKDGGRIRIGREIRKLRISRRYALRELASELIKNRIFDYSVQALEQRISRLEKGHLYFGATTTTATGRRGKENLDLLSKYLDFFKVSEKDRLIDELKRFDKRFSYFVG